MAATEQDIARFTVDGVVLTAARQTVLDQDPNAIDGGASERQLFFDDDVAGQVLLNELFGFLGRIGNIHEAIEIGDNLSLGVDQPLWPAAPQVTLIDDTRGINAATAIRAYSFDMAADRYALELVGTGDYVGTPVTFDTTKTRFDNDQVTWDKAV